MGTESEMIKLSGHLFASLHVGHARRSRAVLNYRITVSGIPDLIHLIPFMNQHFALFGNSDETKNPANSPAVLTVMSTQAYTYNKPLLQHCAIYSTELNGQMRF